MTPAYDPEALTEREAILASDDLPVSLAAVQSACAWWAADPAATLTPQQRAWVQRKAESGSWLTPAEVAHLRPGLLAWADARDVRLGDMLRVALGELPPPSVGRPRNLAFEAGRVTTVQPE